jgi:hypothetical protein
MKSFKRYLIENDNPFVLGRLLKVQVNDEVFAALVIKVEQAVAALLVVTPEHDDCMTILSSKNLPSDTQYHIINQHRLPIQSYFYQSPNTDKIKRIEYHEPKKVNEELDEDVERSALLYFQSKYRSLKNKDETHQKLNLIIEMLLTDFDDHRLRFIS